MGVESALLGEDIAEAEKVFGTIAWCPDIFEPTEQEVLNVRIGKERGPRGRLLYPPH